MRLRHLTAGFSLLELMIALSIVGILAAIAIPAFGELIQNNRRTTVVNELVSNLMLARTEAAKRGQPVTVCGNTSGGGISCTGGTNWNYGWMVFLDGGPPPAGAVAGDGAIADVSHMLRQYVNDYPDIRITSNPSGAAPNTGPVVMRTFSQGSTGGNLVICDKRGASKARTIILSGNGRARVSETTSAGGALTCPP